MRRLFTLLGFTLLIANIGCKKKEDPNVSTFSLYVADFYPGKSTTATISSSLKDGDYTISYKIIGKEPHSTPGGYYYATFSDLTTLVNVKGGKGNFATPSLTYTECLTMTIDSITNSSGKGVALSATDEFCDSTGTMTAYIDGILFSTHHVFSEVKDSILSITGDAEDKSQICIQVSPYHRNMTIQKLPTTLSSSSSYTSYPNGYSLRVKEGNVIFTAISPLMTGTFSFTSVGDYVKVTNGSFKVKLP